MIYRRFGRTELNMPVFSCGGMRYQHSWKDEDADGITDDSQRNLEATIHRALEVGINHIETARGYGTSERQLGRFVGQLKRESLIFQTKNSPNADSQVFVDQVKDSLDRLNLDYVDLLGIHGLNNDETLDWAIRPGGCLEKARELQQQGLVRHVGFSTHGSTDQILRAINAEGPDGRGFDYVNLHWYYIFQRNHPAIAAATKRDMGMFIISPSDKGGKLYDPPAKLVELCKPLHPIVFNDLFCLHNDQVHTLSIGAARPTDFDLHLETLPLLERAGELLPPIIERLENAMEAATGVRHPEQGVWKLPEWESMPGDVNPQIICWLHNLAVGWDMVEYGKMRYNLLGSGGHWFPGLNAEKVDELDLPVSDDVKATLRQAHALLKAADVKRASEGG
jgi:predicted aldo/keto reductase-like oxidoreductase